MSRVRFVDVVAATEEHARELAPRMRRADVDECRAGGMEPLDALLFSIGGSAISRAALIDGRVEMLWGVGPVRPGIGGIWALGSEVRNRHLLTVVARREVAEFLELYPILINRVDARNKASLRWLRRWLGFDVLPAEAHGPSGLPFHPIIRRRNHPCADSPRRSASQAVSSTPPAPTRPGAMP